jgi:hypothetical protein
MPNSIGISISENYLGLINGVYLNNLIIIQNVKANRAYVLDSELSEFVRWTIIHLHSHSIEYECFVKLVLSINFGCMVYGYTYALIYLINIFFVPSPLRFHSEFVVSYIRIQIRSQSLSDPLRR